MKVRLRRYLVAGLLVWLPIGATLLVFSVLFDLMDRFLLLLPPIYRPEALLGFRIPGLGVILAVVVLLLTGLLAANLFGRRLVLLYESVLARIPLVRGVYSSFKHFAEVVFSESETSFKKVLLIEYPRPGLYSIAFQTSENPEEVQARTGDTIVTVFLPTTPNPTSGFMLFVPRKSITELDMSVEDALKMVISLGVVLPRWHAGHPGAKPLPHNTEVAPPEASP
ncbi:MAG: DUF502 domain-containing protein [Gammaproteobacteria bacterium]|nr:DUF502 domain-containing protein [Gammaproteobacteria bacterium]